MTAITTTSQTRQAQPYGPLSAALTIELAKCLKLVAPANMGADSQTVWLQAATDALEGIRADEVQAVSAEIRRSVTRPAQIVPEIAKLVAEKRARMSGSGDVASDLQRAAVAIDREERERIYKSKSSREVGEIQDWARQQRISAGIEVPPKPAPLTRKELDAMPADTIAMGIKGGFLTYRDGLLVEA